ncbi:MULTISPECIES: type II toxin-antitoxin system RelE/ParE family toxin [unclassified Rhizobium]|uniref:type II toxin-antitoxin system RelE/ParE family toxin n=1 Tax=unclassified Rhizobium TaxID=2613769 RepID=UPI0017819118|nr:type II toxin-antitoxin system RelE/ParE family toxin [Rhizobium sp. CFBP 13644]MBD8690755.1 type II toxin-antitoxin system RelE/ParE family toxin [Rhizobium sp. CFBP 13717]
MKLVVSPLARDYIKSEAAYLRKRSPQAALHFRDDLARLRNNLLQYPHIGHEAEDLPIAGIRRFVMGVYLVDYEVRRNEIVILTVRHGQQKPPSLTIDDDFDYEE